MKKEKKFYQKPQIKEVKLVPGEAVLMGCKSTGSAGSKAGRCQSVSTCNNRAVDS